MSNKQLVYSQKHVDFHGLSIIELVHTTQKSKESIYLYVDPNLIGLAMGIPLFFTLFVMPFFVSIFVNFNLLLLVNMWFAILWTFVEGERECTCPCAQTRITSEIPISVLLMFFLNHTWACFLAITTYDYEIVSYSPLNRTLCLCSIYDVTYKQLIYSIQEKNIYTSIKIYVLLIAFVALNMMLT